MPLRQLAGPAMFARYAFPPNELGYCGPAGIAAPDLAAHAEQFDGAWPYLRALAEASGTDDPLDEEVVHNYWIGGRLLDQVDGTALLAHLRDGFRGQVTGLLADLDGPALAHHSFHVFVVYPWVRFLDRDPSTPLRVLQDCRIRWGTVASIDDDFAVLRSCRLTLHAGVLGFSDPVPERVRWRKDGVSLAPAPSPGVVVAAHWDWVCGVLTVEDAAALDAATQSVLDLVNGAQRKTRRRTDSGGTQGDTQGDVS
jgi:Family of unknown function (DUF6390)